MIIIMIISKNSIQSTIKILFNVGYFIKVNHAKETFIQIVFRKKIKIK